MTHGQMMVTDGERDVHLYAYHSGFTTKALELLLELPFIIFESSKQFYECWQHERRMPPTYGPHLYSLFADTKKKESFEDLLDNWAAMIPLQTGVLEIANWIVWSRFNLWQVVPSKDWMAYPHDSPDITIRVHGNRIVSYDLVVGAGLNMPGNQEFDTSSQEYIDQLFLTLDNAVESVNYRLSQKESKVTIYGKKTLTNDGCNWKFPRISVPFDRIVVDLLYQEFCLKKKKKKKKKNEKD